jgi:hypothetical protein
MMNKEIVMVNMHIYTQDYENYGSPQNPYWKAKGGEDFILQAESWTEEMIDKAVSLIEIDSDMFLRSIIGYQPVCDEFTFDKFVKEYV